MELVQTSVLMAEESPTLAQQAAQGDSAAFSVLVRRCEGLLFSIAASYFSQPGDRADAVQEALLRAWRKISSLRQPQYFQTWLVRILINECKSMCRRRQDLPLPDALPVYQESGPALDIRIALASLDRKTRLAATLYYFGQYSVSEISSLLRVPAGTVKSRLHRARIQLKEELKDYDER